MGKASCVHGVLWYRECPDCQQEEQAVSEIVVQDGSDMEDFFQWVRARFPEMVDED